ncbi:CLUMA_CG009480, isoform A [Clunio marinus]|uniref:CLUMA_CG009480, isoform A n=1 Tax=Clunio marinus TaxID=568069 RepID=A0A1J1I796_9DIPT|nr:CLUMA_CG009480, isoform A [Clunio marinus]
MLEISFSVVFRFQFSPSLQIQLWKRSLKAQIAKALFYHVARCNDSKKNLFVHWYLKWNDEDKQYIQLCAIFCLALGNNTFIHLKADMAAAEEKISSKVCLTDELYSDLSDNSKGTVIGCDIRTNRILNCLCYCFIYGLRGIFLTKTLHHEV